MPSYRFRCNDCQVAHDAYLEMFEERPTSCPSCSGPLAQVFAGQAPQGIVYGNPKTVGQQAELNEKRMGKEQMEMLAAKASLRNRNPSRRAPSEGVTYDTGGFLDLNKVPDQTKYIMTGEA